MLLLLGVQNIVKELSIIIIINIDTISVKIDLLLSKKTFTRMLLALNIISCLGSWMIEGYGKQTTVLFPFFQVSILSIIKYLIICI